MSHCRVSWSTAPFFRVVEDDPAFMLSGDRESLPLTQPQAITAATAHPAAATSPADASSIAVTYSSPPLAIAAHPSPPEAASTLTISAASASPASLAPWPQDEVGSTPMHEDQGINNEADVSQLRDPYLQPG